mgnify:CR=1 FL=1
MTKLNESRKSHKFMWYGWRKEAGRHFGVGSEAIIRWARGQEQGTSVKMRRLELKEWCEGRLRSAGKTEEEILEKTIEVFGEC